MKEIKVAKYSKQWRKTRMTIYTIIWLISFCAFVITMLIMGCCYDEYGLHHVKTIVSISFNHFCGMDILPFKVLAT